MRKKVLFLLAVILSLNVSMIRVNAEVVIQMKVTFSEVVTASPSPNEDFPMISKSLPDTSGTFPTALSTGKRLPTTGDQCNQSLTLLGYLSLFVFVLCMILGRRRGAYPHEST